MLRGMRTGIKFFTLGLLIGFVFAPRKGSETVKMLVGRGKEYAEENLSISGRGRRDSEE
jgi:hypothetical protein